MKIQVFSEDAIQQFKTDKKHIVISIQDPRHNFVQLSDQVSRVGWLGLWFYDFDELTGQENYDKFIFNKYQARNILNFINEHKNNIDLIAVNCVAGVSRSAGTAAALSKILNNDDFYYFKNYSPNMKVYREILNEYHKKDK